MTWTIEQKQAYLQPGYAHTMSSLSKRLIIRHDGPYVIYEKIKGDGVQHLAPDTYGRCHVQAFWNQMRYRPEHYGQHVCPVHPTVYQYLLMKEAYRRRQLAGVC